MMATRQVLFQERILRQSRLIRPEYSAHFRCIGPACEDSCCEGWTVPIEQEAYEKYQSVPAGPLRILLDQSIVRTPDAPMATQYAKINMPPSFKCPILTEERLCRIHAELGEEFLCRTCATYPRVVTTIDNLEEKALSLSCPEAARLVLLDPDLMTPSGDGGYQMTWDDSPQRGKSLLPFFWPIREFVFALIRNRVYPMWQRLFLLGSFCRRLDAVVRGEADRGVTDVLRDFPAVAATGNLRAAMEQIPADLPQQLDMVLRLAGIGHERAQLNSRFIECLEAFKTGIEVRPDATLPDLVAAYTAAHERNFAPFFAAHPYILENLVANAIFRRQFPFGFKDGKIDPEPEAARQFALLATQFALIKGLLIGVAGCHKENFSAAHVVHTIQSASKHFEHHPQFIEQIHELLVKMGRDNPHGLTMLLRN
jgi:lysine-N-methylase